MEQINIGLYLQIDLIFLVWIHYNLRPVVLFSSNWQNNCWNFIVSFLGYAKKRLWIIYCRGGIHKYYASFCVTIEMSCSWGLVLDWWNMCGILWFGTTSYRFLAFYCIYCPNWNLPFQYMSSLSEFLCTLMGI